MRNLFLFILLVSSCKSVNHISDSKTKQKILIGTVTKQDLLKEPYASCWFNKNYKKYRPKKYIISQLKTKCDSVNIKVFMGTWCGDSKKGIPQFYKIVDELNYNNFKLIALNKAKKANNLEKGYNIKLVPTFIVFKSGKEIGRIIEKPKKNSTLEKDLLRIINLKIKR